MKRNIFLQIDRKLKSHFLTIISVAFCTMIYSASSAQGEEGVDGDLFIENCYQKIKMYGGEYRLLRDGFSFSRTSTTTAGDWLWFRGFHNEDGEVVIDNPFLKYSGYSIGEKDIVTPGNIYRVDEIIQIDDTSFKFDPLFNLGIVGMYNSSSGFGEDFVFDILDNNPSIVKLEITVISYNEDIKRFTYGKSSTTTFHIVEKDKILDTEIGNDEGCLTFEHFQMNGGVNLDGLCGEVKNELALPSNGIDPPEVVSDQFYFGDYVTFDYLGDHCEECLEMAAEAYPINESPISCGCRDYVLKTSLMPCYGKEHICEPLVIYEDVQVCCECDIRDFHGPLN